MSLSGLRAAWSGTRRVLFGLALTVVPFTPGEGSGKADFALLDRAIVEGIQRGVYPGAVVVVGRSDAILHARGFGRLAWSTSSHAPSPDSTLYDLASLTKIVATSSAALVLADRGKLDIDAPVSRYLGEFSRGSQRAVTVRMLLDHTSGLRPYAEFYKVARTRAGIVARLLREQPIRVPGDTAVYSDINAMLLGLVIERLTGESLDRFVTREILQPLNMSETGFRPSSARQRRTAPGYLNGSEAVSGVVHDMNARGLGGVAGHAGLFGTGLDLARFAQWWLQEGESGGRQLVSRGAMERFLHPGRRAAGSRLLGWDSPDPQVEPPSVFGSLLSTRAFGHTGWTGTQIWVDPEKDLFVILLTNRSMNQRVTPSLRDLRAIRARVAEAAVQATMFSGD